jgi:hypothetical protein
VGTDKAQCKKLWFMIETGLFQQPKLF